MGIDVIFPLSSVKWLPYVQNASRFVRMQDYPRDQVGIIISYLHSEVEPLTELAVLCRDFDATLVMGRRTRTDGFETPLARNMGIRRATRETIALIDGDVLLNPRTFEIAASEMCNGGGVIVPVADMDKWPADPFYLCADADELAAVARRDGKPRQAAMGALIVPRRAAVEIRGYDERMYGWGADDTDFVERLRRHGTKMVLLSNVPFAMHQHHAKEERSVALTRRNQRYYRERAPVRNEQGWGGIPSSATTTSSP